MKYINVEDKIKQLSDHIKNNKNEFVEAIWVCTDEYMARLNLDPRCIHMTHILLKPYIIISKTLYDMLRDNVESINHIEQLFGVPIRFMNAVPRGFCNLPPIEIDYKKVKSH